MHMREKTFERLPAMVETQPRESRAAILGYRRQGAGGIRLGGPVHHVLNIWIEVAVDGRGILAYHGIQVSGDQLRVRLRGGAQVSFLSSSQNGGRFRPAGIKGDRHW